MDAATCSAVTVMADGRLKDGERSYYRRVEGILEGGEEEEDVFLRNVVDQLLSDGALRVCCDKEASRVSERLLHHPALKDEDLLRLAGALSESYHRLAVHKYGSHVAEALVRVVARKLSDPLEAVLLSVCSTVRGCLSEFIAHPYGSHVVSCLLQGLAGLELGEGASRSTYSRRFREAKMPQVEGGGRRGNMAPRDSRLQLLDRFGKRVCKLADLAELLAHENASPVLQVLLRLLAQRCPARGQKLIRKILRSPNVFLAPDDEGSLPAMFTNVVGSHLMQCVIEVASPQLCQHMYDSFFKERVMTFALHPVANYPLQELIVSVRPEEVASLMEALRPLEDILFVGHSGVVVKLVEKVIADCPELQPSLLESLLTAFHTQSSPRSCAPLFLSLSTYEAYHRQPDGSKEQEELKINTAGSLLVQSLLKFQDPKLIVSSILRMSTDDLIRTSCDPSGSHVMEAFMGSTTVPVKRKCRLLDRLKPCLVPLCTDKHGSRVMDGIWKNCEIGQKESLAQELLAHEDKLTSNFYGRIVLHNCHISHYKRKQVAWQEQERGVAKRREEFRDILEGHNPEKHETVLGNSRGRKRKRCNGDSVSIKKGKVSPS